MPWRDLAKLRFLLQQDMIFSNCYKYCAPYISQTPPIFFLEIAMYLSLLEVTQY